MLSTFFSYSSIKGDHLAGSPLTQEPGIENGSTKLSVNLEAVNVEALQQFAQEVTLSDGCLAWKIPRLASRALDLIMRLTRGK